MTVKMMSFLRTLPEVFFHILIINNNKIISHFNRGYVVLSQVFQLNITTLNWEEILIIIFYVLLINLIPYLSPPKVDFSSQLHLCINYNNCNYFLTTRSAL